MVEWLKQYVVYIAIGIVIIGILLIMNNSQVDSLTEINSPNNVTPETVELESTISSSKLVVDIKGAVNFPGVYEMEEFDRVQDAIQKAGGFKEDADQTMINLAQRVHDEMVILVLEKGDNPSNLPDLSNQSAKLRINYATVEEIQTLNGIGPQKAQAILQYREDNGAFKNVEELLNVSGIGEKTLENIKDFIQIP